MPMTAEDLKNLYAESTDDNSEAIIDPADLNPEAQFKMTIQGEETLVPVKTLLEKYNKSEAAGKGLEELANQRKAFESERRSYQNDLKIVDDLRKAMTNQDTGALRRVAMGMGVGEKDVDDYMSMLDNVTNETTTGKGAAHVQVDPDSQEFFREMKNAGITPQAMARILTQGVNAQGEVELNKRVRNTLDVMAPTGYNKDETRAGALEKIAQGFLARRVMQTKAREITPGLIRDSVQEALDHAKQLGISFDGKDMGTGGSQGPLATVFRTAEGYPAEKPMKRPRSTLGDDYDNFIGQEVMRRLLEKDREA